MTRRSAGLTAMLSMFFPIGAAHALEASDTMAAWKNASAAEKGVLVDKLLNGRGAARVIRCVDEASGAPGHADLPITQMIKACEKGDANEPV